MPRQLLTSYRVRKTPPSEGRDSGSLDTDQVVGVPRVGGDGRPGSAAEAGASGGGTSGRRLAPSGSRAVVPDPVLHPRRVADDLGR